MPNSDRTIFEIDHLLTHVSSLATAAATYVRLGFTLTPHSDITAMGIANQLVTFQPRSVGAANFIELMAVTHAPRLPPSMAHVLSGADATRAMVLATEDPDRAQVAFNALGYPFAPPVHVRREWKIGSSDSVFPEFDVLLPVPAPLMFNACRYRDVSVYLRPEWQTHANHAEMLDAVFAVDTSPDDLARHYSRVLAAPVRAIHEGARAISPGHVALEIFDREGFGRMSGDEANAANVGFVGFRILVSDTVACRAVLERNGISFLSRPNGDTVVPARLCHGNTVVFRSRDAVAGGGQVA